MDSLEREALERKKKLIALGCLPLSVGFFVWRLQGSTSAAPPPPPPPPPVVAKAAPAVAAAAGSVPALQLKKMAAIPKSGKDPFRPAFALNTGESAKPAPKDPAGTVATELPTRLATLPTLPMPGLRPFEPLPNPNAPVKPLAPPAKPAAPVVPYVLTGIVKGQPDVAILRHADGSRRIARVGDLLDQKYRLAVIEETSVRIEGAGIKKTLELGEAGFNPAARDAGQASKSADLGLGTLTPKTETTLGEGNDTNNS
jgi:hypothetical protein